MTIPNLDASIIVTCRPLSPLAPQDDEASGLFASSFKKEEALGRERCVTCNATNYGASRDGDGKAFVFTLKSARQ